eukprot:314371-Pyramimonas_sp.AAC.1
MVEAVGEPRARSVPAEAGVERSLDTVGEEVGQGVTRLPDGAVRLCLGSVTASASAPCDRAADPGGQVGDG